MICNILIGTMAAYRHHRWAKGCMGQGEGQQQDEKTLRNSRATHHEAETEYRATTATLTIFNAHKNPVLQAAGLANPTQVRDLAAVARFHQDLPLNNSIPFP
jgi:hypothetical protein